MHKYFMMTMYFIVMQTCRGRSWNRKTNWKCHGI